MRTNQIAKYTWSNDGFHSYQGKLVQEIYIDQRMLFVFTGISGKRVQKDKIYSNREYVLPNWRKTKVIFITNKQLMDRTHQWYNLFSNVRKLVFDRKAGTRYQAEDITTRCTGDYFSCLTSTTISIKRYN